jgi:predicted  nucleic acid-binding Zn-ribbon protein
MSNPLSQALDNLGNTINSITGKVDQNKQKVKDYKAKIVAKLGEITSQIEALKNNDKFKSIPGLRNTLEQTQAELQAKTNELDKTKSDLAAANTSLQELRTKITDLETQINQKNDEIKRLTDEGATKDGQLQSLKDDVTRLTNEKNEAETKLADSTQQINSLIQRIAQINSTLVNQISLIDTITSELGDLDNSNDAISMEFKAVADNIISVINMINNPTGPSGAPPPPPPRTSISTSRNTAQTNYRYLMSLSNDPTKLAKFYSDNEAKGPTQKGYVDIIKANIDAAKRGDNNAKDLVMEANNNLWMSNSGISGGRRTKRRKSRARRSTKKYKRKQKGGYVYSTGHSKEQKELDRRSSVVSNSSASKSSSQMKTKSRSRRRSQ